MDLEHITHLSYRKSIAVAIVLSMLVVTFTALLGRGTANLRSALASDEPTDVTVIVAVESKLENEKITNITFLRKENPQSNTTGKPFYTYLVETSRDIEYFTRLGWNASTALWDLITFEPLHGGV